MESIERFGEMRGVALRDGVYLADVTAVRLRRVADTREYPKVEPEPVVELARSPVPAWAIVVMTLGVLVNLICWPLAAWRYWHG